MASGLDRLGHSGGGAATLATYRYERNGEALRWLAPAG